MAKSSFSVNRFTFGRTELIRLRALGIIEVPMTIKNTAFYAFSFGLVLVGALLPWASGPDLVLGLLAFLQ